jgi:hypothetical protein
MDPHLAETGVCSECGEEFDQHDVLGREWEGEDVSDDEMDEKETDDEDSDDF